MAAAAIPTLVPVEEYLHAVYKPDMDYVDGLLEENSLGEMDHSGIQRNLVFLLCQISPALRARTFPEARVQVAPTRFRVPDVCILAEGFGDSRIIRQPPVLCLEILSPEDRMNRVLRRARDFFAMGVPEIWIFDPEETKAYRLLPGTILQEVAGTLVSQTGQVTLDLSQVFATART